MHVKTLMSDGIGDYKKPFGLPNIMHVNKNTQYVYKESVYYCVLPCLGLQ